MKKIQNKIPAIAVVALAYAVFTAVPAELQAQAKLSVDEISDFKLSGYDKGSEGNILWAINAQKAEIDHNDKDASTDLNKATWHAQKVNLFTYNKGKKFASMKSDSAVFYANTKTAKSDAAVTVTGETFSVRGVGWDWENTDAGNTIHVRKNIVVSLTPQGKQDKINIVSDTLSITGTDEITVLMFSGNVSVIYGEVFTRCENIRIEIPGKVSGDELQSSSSGSDLKSVEKISGSGNVRIKRGTQTVTGNEVEFFPRTDTFKVNENAEFEDSSGNVKVSGDTARGNIKSSVLGVTGKDGEPVIVMLPPLNINKAGPRAKNSRLSGDELNVHTENDEIVISVKNNVELSEKELNVKCNALTMRSTREVAEETDGKADVDAVKKITAEGDVTAKYGDKVLTCVKAEIFPNTKRALLTGSPQVVSKTEGATLTAYSFDIDLENGAIDASSSPAGATPAKRVCATLPAFSELSKTPSSSGKQLATRTMLFGDDLCIRRNSDFTTFDMLGNVILSADDISGTCDRMAVFTKSSGKSGNSLSPQIQRIAAIGNVSLEQRSAKITGGIADIYPEIDVKEWLVEDDNGMDGKAPTLITVTGDEDSPQKNRPRFYAPTDGDSPLRLAFAKEDGEKSSDSTAKQPTEKDPAYIEGDSLEVISGESRTRFFLRGDVKLVSSEASGSCRSLEGLLYPPKNATAGTHRMEVEKIIGRGDVFMENAGSKISGNILEIMPREKLASISGNAKFIDRGGIRITPGNDRFIFDLEKRELVTRASMDEKSGQVSRPRIIIPGESDKAFLGPRRKK